MFRLVVYGFVMYYSTILMNKNKKIKLNDALA